MSGEKGVTENVTLGETGLATVEVPVKKQLERKLQR